MIVTSPLDLRSAFLVLVIAGGYVSLDGMFAISF